MNNGNTVIIRTSNAFKALFVCGKELRVSESATVNAYDMKLDTDKGSFYYLIYPTNLIKFLLQAIHQGYPIEYRDILDISTDQPILDEDDIKKHLPQTK